jgi:hypothetical protein
MKAIFTVVLVALLLAACGGGNNSSSSGDSSISGSDNKAAKENARQDATALPEVPGEVPTSLDGEELQLNKPYGGGTRIKSTVTGTSFETPDGWNSTQGAGGYLFTMLPPAGKQMNMTGQGMFGAVMLGLSGITDDGLKALLCVSIPLPLGRFTLVFAPQGEPTREGSALRQAYLCTTAYGTYYGFAAAVKGPANNAINFTIAGSESMKDEMKQVLDKLVSSAKFARPDDKKRRTAMLSQINGRKLLRMNSKYTRNPDGTSSSHFEDFAWNLYTDGSYTFKGDTSFNINPGGGSGANSGTRGRWWLVVGHSMDFLVLQPVDGKASSSTLAFSGGSLFMNGEKIGITDID